MQKVYQNDRYTSLLHKFEIHKKFYNFKTNYLIRRTLL